MVIIPDLYMAALKEECLPMIDHEIMEAHDKGKPRITISMRTIDAEVLKWLISSFQIARSEVEVPIEAFEHLYLQSDPDDIIHEMQKEASYKIVDDLMNKACVGIFSHDDTQKQVKRISLQLCVISYPGNIQKGE